MVYADLHVHTTRSDGSLAPDAVAETARDSGLSAVAITDHERLPPLSAPVAERDGVTVIGGCELRVEPENGERVDLLGYGVEPTEALESTIEEIQCDRRERGRRMVERVEDEVGIELDLSVETGIGRPNVARAIANHPGTELGYQDAFDELIGDDGPCYVPRTIPSFERGVAVLDEACGVVGLAHPLRYDDPAAALELTAELDAVEREYAYGRPVDLDPVDRAIEANDLLATGGSDAHEPEAVGTVGVDRTTFERVVERLTR